MTDQMTRREIAGHANNGRENAGHENAGHKRAHKQRTFEAEQTVAFLLGSLSLLRYEKCRRLK